MSKVKPLRAIRLLTQHGANALRFSVNNGRKAADLRKTAIIEGTYGSFIPNVGGWDPAWDEPKKMYMLKPNKGHLRERTRPKRAEKIDIAMKAMPERIAKYKQELVDRRPKKDIVSMFQRVLTLQKGGGGPGGV